MRRWKLLASRLILVAVVSLAVWLFGDTLLRFWLAYQCQSISGADIEFGSVRANMFGGTLQISGLCVADPRNPMTNLIQADTALLKLNPALFWRREFVVEHGVVRNVKFDTPHASVGKLARSPAIFEQNIQWLSREFELEQAKLQQQFIAQFQQFEFVPQDPQFRLLRISRELPSRQPLHGYDQKREVESLQTRLAILASKLQANCGNPLREADRIPALIEQLRQIECELSQAKENLKQLRNQLDTDRESLLEAKEADAQIISQRATRRFGDGQALSKILVGPDQKGVVEDVVRWIRWIRSAALDPDTDFPSAAGRGVNVQFQRNCNPTFWIQSLELDGRGRFAGQTFQFLGNLRNLTLQPRLLPEPCVVELRTSGGRLAIRGELDRRAKDKLDHITLDCADLDMPNQMLGNEHGLRIDVGPSRLSAHIDVRIHGNTIDGTVVLANADVAMQTTKTESPVFSPELTIALDRELESIRGFSTEIRLAGKLEDIQIEMVSDLGQKLGPVAARVAQIHAKATAQIHLSQLENLYQSELAQFNQVSKHRLDEWTELLESGATRVAELDRLVPAPNGLNRIR